MGDPKLAGKIVHCFTHGRRAQRYRVVFNSDGEAISVETVIRPPPQVHRRKLWRLCEGKEPSITACCAIRAAIKEANQQSDHPFDVACAGRGCELCNDKFVEFRLGSQSDGGSK